VIVYDNDIFGSKSEGIFVVESRYSWIWNNRIHDNIDGIVIVDSNPYVLKNDVNSN